MKTLREYETERRKNREIETTNYNLKVSLLLAASKGIVPDKDRADVRAEIRSVLENSSLRHPVKFFEFCCDHCLTQLVNVYPTMVLASNPPQEYTHCPGCGRINTIFRE